MLLRFLTEVYTLFSVYVCIRQPADTEVSWENRIMWKMDVVFEMHFPHKTRNKIIQSFEKGSIDEFLNEEIRSPYCFNFSNCLKKFLLTDGLYLFWWKNQLNNWKELEKWSVKPKYTLWYMRRMT